MLTRIPNLLLIGMNNFELMTNANKQHLVSLGVFSFNQFAGDTGISFIQRKYPTFFGNDIKPAFEASLDRKSVV